MKKAISKILKKEKLRAFQWLAAIMLIFVAANLAAAQVYDPFDYQPGIPTSSQTLNGGTGWIEPWGGGTGVTTSPGLTYPGLTVAGNALGESGNFPTRMLQQPISDCSMRIAVLIKSPIDGSPGTYAAMGNWGAPRGSNFIIGDLAQKDARAGNWGMIAGLQKYYSNVPVLAGATVYLVAQIDFNASGDNERTRLWVNPPALNDLATGTLPAFADIDITDNNIESFNGVWYQSGLQGQTIDEIRIEKISSGGTAQNSAQNWVFGQNARIDFNSASPAVSNNVALNTSEGSASISDTNGNLLFYTNGVRVWDRNNNPMPNGEGLTGSVTSTQSALIVPCSCDRYFIFTTGTFQPNFVPGFPGRYAAGFRYSIVDMSLNNGFGDVEVLSKNTMLMPRASEKVAAVTDGKGGFWVVAHNMGNNQFFAYHIIAGSDCALDPQSVEISSVGANLTAGYGRGQMKISPDGTMLALAADNTGPSFVELFQFDKNTGHVSGFAGGVPRKTSTNGFYGIEFSPDSQSLYATTRRGSNVLFRYSNITSGTLSNPATHSFGNGSGLIGALQTAPDGRLYIARKAKSFLFVLNSPNAPTGPPVQFFLAPGSKSITGLPSLIAGTY